MLSAKDVIRGGGEIVADLMSPNPLTVKSSTRVTDAISIMLTNRIACLPVVHGDVPCGILTSSDLAMGLQCTLRALEPIALAIGGAPSTDADVLESQAQAAPLVAV